MQSRVVTERAHAVVANAANKVRDYLESVGITGAVIEEVVADGDGQKVCVLNINFPVTGKEKVSV